MTENQIYKVKLTINHRLLSINKLLLVGNEYHCTIGTDYRTCEKFWQDINSSENKFDTFGTKIIEVE